MSGSVFIAWHTHETADGEDLKVLGVYSTEALAQQRVALAKTEPGFRDHPEGLEVAEHGLDEDAWLDGFKTLPYDATD